jgi:hypothetical protein
MKCKAYRRELLSFPWFRGVLKRGERKHLLSQSKRVNKCHFLVEHAAPKDSCSLYLYILHPRMTSDTIKHIKIQLYHNCATNEWSADLLPGMRQQFVYDKIEDLTDFYLDFHCVTSPHECGCAVYYSARSCFQPQSLFDLSAFVTRSYFYHERKQLLKPILPTTLYDYVFVQPLELNLIPP